jgi:kynurenine formamidase
VKFIDLSHTISPGLVTYPGLPAPSMTAFLSREHSREKYAGQAEFHIGRIDMVGNTGTYLDAPWHRFEGGANFASLALEKVAALPGIVIDHGEAFPDDVAGRAVLIRTGWSRHFGTEAYGHGSPFITAAQAKMLADGGAALVGIDSLNIDDTADPARPAHTILLGRGILVLEHLTALDQLPKSGFELFAVPPKVLEMGSFPVRAFALIR